MLLCFLVQHIARTTNKPTGQQIKLENNIYKLVLISISKIWKSLFSEYILSQSYQCRNFSLTPDNFIATVIGAFFDTWTWHAYKNDWHTPLLSPPIPTPKFYSKAVRKLSRPSYTSLLWHFYRHTHTHTAWGVVHAWLGCESLWYLVPSPPPSLCVCPLLSSLCSSSRCSLCSSSSSPSPYFLSLSTRISKLEDTCHV